MRQNRWDSRGGTGEMGMRVETGELRQERWDRRDRTGKVREER